MSNDDDDDAGLTSGNFFFGLPLPRFATIPPVLFATILGASAISGSGIRSFCGFARDGNVFLVMMGGALAMAAPLLILLLLEGSPSPISE